MGIHFAPSRQDALYRHWAAASREIVLACDPAGRIIQATPAAAQLGGSHQDGLLGLHLWDCLEPLASLRLRELFGQALADGHPTEWIEVELDNQPRSRRWYELRIDPVLLSEGYLPGAVCILRSIAERRELEREAFAAAMTDQLTGFTNRAAFSAMLDHLSLQGVTGCLILIDLDRFRAFNLRYGHAAGDRLLKTFADLLRHLTSAQHILSRIDGESFAVIMPGERLATGTDLGQAVRSALAEIAHHALPGELPFTASIGVVPLEGGRDATLRAAELAVTEAKARGRARVAVYGPGRLRLPWAWRGRSIGAS
ncbi:MAG: GGDEF domain-containing protein [Sphingomonadaceae bacterium]|nr:GGDEF domain-containing protein [Sphingomonadaceae bacterium]